MSPSGTRSGNGKDKKPRGPTEFPTDPDTIGRIQMSLAKWASKDVRFENVDIAHAMETVFDWAKSNGKRKKDWTATVRGAIRDGWAFKPRADSPPRLPVVKAKEPEMEKATPEELAAAAKEREKILSETQFGRDRKRKGKQNGSA